MMGLYGESKSSLRKTKEFALSLPLDIVNFAVAAPYPGTEFHKILLAASGEAERSFVNPGNDWEKYDQNYSAIVGYKDLTPTYISRYIKWSYIRWYCRPYGLWKIFKAYRPSDTWFWIKTAWNHLC